MRLRGLISRGWVVIVGALVTGGALALSRGPSSAPGRGSARPELPAQARAQVARQHRANQRMKRQVDAMQSLCAAGPNPIGSAPAPDLSVSRGGVVSQLILARSQATLCMQRGMLLSNGGPVPRLRTRADTLTVYSVVADRDHARRWVVEYGRAGAHVSAARFMLRDGEHADAAVGSGWFLVMWQGAQDHEVSGCTPRRVGTPCGWTAPWTSRRRPAGPNALPQRCCDLRGCFGGDAVICAAASAVTL